MLNTVISLILIIQLSIKNLLLFQIQYYNTYRFLKLKFSKINYKYLLMLPLMIIDYIYNDERIVLLTLMLLILFNIPKNSKLVKLKFTNRIIRLFSLTLFINLYLLINIKNNHLSYIFLLLSSNILIILLSNAIDYITRFIINTKEKNKLKKKLKQIHPLIIGITGSYGKTSFKNYLEALLKRKYNVLKTSGNINTFKGVINFLNKNLNSNIEIIILEIGLDSKGGMDKFLKMFSFDYGVLTGLEKCHLSTFKTIENIINEKMKILTNSKVGYINVDNNYVKETLYNSYSLIDLEYSYFKDKYIYFKIKNIDKGFKTSIIGDHHLLNIIGAIKIAKDLNLDDNLIYNALISLKNEKHRYELKYIDNMQVIDDAYNSNETGFKKALDSLRYFNSYKILITPGVIELGKENQEVNYRLGLYIVDKVDEVILIGENSLSIKKALNEIKYINYKYFNTYKEGYSYLKTINKDFIVLIENDLLDYYLK